MAVVCGSDNQIFGTIHNPDRMTRSASSTIAGYVNSGCRSRRQQRLNKFKTIKWAQITDRFAGTDEADRQLGLRRHR